MPVNNQNKPKKRSFCIIGLGRFGQTLAVNLARTDHQVLVIDLDSTIVNAMSDIVTNAVIGDATSDAVLHAAGVRDYDCAVVCMASDINASILITLMLKEMGIPQVVVRAGSAQHRRVLEKIGADLVVFPEQDMGEKLVSILDRQNVLEYIEFSDTHSIVEVSVPAKWVGKSLIELDVRRQYGVTVIAVGDPETGKLNVSPDPAKAFAGSETVSLLGSNEAIDRITR